MFQLHTALAELSHLRTNYLQNIECMLQNLHNTQLRILLQLLS
jgi:hypothetical protein